MVSTARPIKRSVLKEVITLLGFDPNKVISLYLPNAHGGFIVHFEDGKDDRTITELFVNDGPTDA